MGGALPAQFQQQQQYQPSPSKVNPFYSMNINQAHGFVPVMPSHVAPVTTSALNSPMKASKAAMEGLYETNFSSASDSQKTFVERSMYKREICKNWQETGFCRFGTKC